MDFFKYMIDGIEKDPDNDQRHIDMEKRKYHQLLAFINSDNPVAALLKTIPENATEIHQYLLYLSYYGTVKRIIIGLGFTYKDIIEKIESDSQPDLIKYVTNLRLYVNRLLLLYMELDRRRKVKLEQTEHESNDKKQDYPVIYEFGDVYNGTLHWTEDLQQLSYFIAVLKSEMPMGIVSIDSYIDLLSNNKIISINKKNFNGVKTVARKVESYLKNKKRKKAAHLEFECTIDLNLAINAIKPLCSKITPKN